MQLLFFYLLIFVQIYSLYFINLLNIQMNMHLLQLNVHDRKIIIFLFVLFVIIFYMHVQEHLYICRNILVLLYYYYLGDSYLCSYFTSLLVAMFYLFFFALLTNYLIYIKTYNVFGLHF